MIDFEKIHLSFGFHFLFDFFFSDRSESRCVHCLNINLFRPDYKYSIYTEDDMMKEINKEEDRKRGKE